MRLAGIVNDLAAHAAQFHMYDTEDLVAAIAELESFDLSTMQEYRIGAESAIAASLKVLKPELERRKEAEAQAAELAKLRAEAAERAEKDRLEAIAKAAREQAEREAKEAVERDEQERQAAEQRAKDAEARIAELQSQHEAEPEDSPELVQTTGFRSEAGMQAAEEYVKMERREADEEHRNQIDNEAAEGMASACNMQSEVAQMVITAITKGLVPHVTINY